MDYGTITLTDCLFGHLSMLPRMVFFKDSAPMDSLFHNFSSIRPNLYQNLLLRGIFQRDLLKNRSAARTNCIILHISWFKYSNFNESWIGTKISYYSRLHLLKAKLISDLFLLRRILKLAIFHAKRCSVGSRFSGSGVIPPYISDPSTPPGLFIQRCVQNSL